MTPSVDYAPKLRGCVFIDTEDHKMCVLRGSLTCVPIAQCGLALGSQEALWEERNSRPWYHSGQLTV